MLKTKLKDAISDLKTKIDFSHFIKKHLTLEFFFKILVGLIIFFVGCDYIRIITLTNLLNSELVFLQKDNENLKKNIEDLTETIQDLKSQEELKDREIDSLVKENKILLNKINTHNDYSKLGTAAVGFIANYAVNYVFSTMVGPYISNMVGKLVSNSLKSLYLPHSGSDFQELNAEKCLLDAANNLLWKVELDNDTIKEIYVKHLSTDHFLTKSQFIEEFRTNLITSRMETRLVPSYVSEQRTAQAIDSLIRNIR